MEGCAFCAIANEAESRRIVWRLGEEYVAFRDMAPRAQTHLLVVPTKHAETIEDTEDVPELMHAAMDAARDAGLSSYQLRVNVRPPLQVVPHVHVHVMSPS